MTEISTDDCGRYEVEGIPLQGSREVSLVIDRHYRNKEDSSLLRYLGKCCYRGERDYWHVSSCNEFCTQHVFSDVNGQAVFFDCDGDIDSVPEHLEEVTR